jgi:RNA polymerase sigma-70 factor, ECF subfamily
MSKHIDDFFWLMMISEEQIIAGCLAGKRFERNMLYKKYASKMLGICLRYATNKAEAEDVLMEGFMKIYSNIKAYRNDGSFEGWMKRIMVNTSITHYRKNNKYHFIEIDHLELSDTESSDEENGNDGNQFSKEEMLQVIQQLPEGYKMVFNLFVFEDYSHKEIAELLEISENTSKTQLLKARKWLRKKLQELSVKTVATTKTLAYERES